MASPRCGSAASYLLRASAPGAAMRAWTWRVDCGAQRGLWLRRAATCAEQPQAFSSAGLSAEGWPDLPP